jgi:hypothetical protein
MTCLNDLYEWRAERLVERIQVETGGQLQKVEGDPKRYLWVHHTGTFLWWWYSDNPLIDGYNLVYRLLTIDLWANAMVGITETFPVNPLWVFELVRMRGALP